VNNKIINIGSGLGIKIAELAKLIAGFYPGTKITFVEREDFMPYHSVADNTLAKEVLGFRPSASIEFLREKIKEIDDHEKG
jgi:nucleoside-diphosphate-sugar epimerase